MHELKADLSQLREEDIGELDPLNLVAMLLHFDSSLSSWNKGVIGEIVKLLSLKLPLLLFFFERKLPDLQKT